MAANLANAARVAIRQAIRTARVSATVWRGEESFRIEAAALGAFRAADVGTDGEPIRIAADDARDLIVWPDDWTLETPPEAGDRFEIEMPGGLKRWFECSPFPPEPAMRWTDRFETAYRIHLKKIEV